MNELQDSASIKLEEDHVKQVYELISEDFSSTRYKKWPKVETFVNELPNASLLLDAGCGNGKYLDNTRNTINIGCDISRNLLLICRKKGFEVVQCDLTRHPFRANSFDAVICIAALHHISSHKRRLQCMNSLVGQALSVGSRALIYVWAYEQKLEGNPYLKKQESSEVVERQTRKLELNDGNSLELPIHVNRTPFEAQDVLVPFHAQSKNERGEKSETFLRYYHVYKQGELEQEISSIPNCTICSSYNDCGNWCCVVEKSSETCSKLVQKFSG